MDAVLLFFGLLLQVIGLLGLAGLFDNGIFSRIGREERMRADIISLQTELAELKSRILFLEGRMARMNSTQAAGGSPIFRCGLSRAYRAKSEEATREFFSERIRS